MSGWGLSGVHAAVSVTFDNLGEAAQLQLGMWPEDVPQGQHFTVLEVLPRLLELLNARGLRASFFLEGLNAEMYPDALHAIAAAGHEVAVHAWRHEQWAALDAETEAALLDRATAALRSIGLSPRGFRPPGGGLTAHTLGLLAEHGYSYVSPAGEREGLRDGLAVLPFRWPLVDAYAYLPQFADLRARYGTGPDPHGPERMREEMVAALRAHAERAGHLALLFHPLSVAFTGEEGWAALDAVLGETARLAADGAVAALRMDEAAAWMLARPEDFNHPPQLDDATWMAPSA
ncbi:MAG: polysaccharide deacetylase family protein [Solirubrobacterales bacterium]